MHAKRAWNSTLRFYKHCKHILSFEWNLKFKNVCIYILSTFIFLSTILVTPTSPNFHWRYFYGNKSSHQRCSIKKLHLKIWQNSQENTYVFLAEICNFIKNETLPHVFSCGFFEIFKNESLAEHLLVTVSVFGKSMTDANLTSCEKHVNDLV